MQRPADRREDELVSRAAPVFYPLFCRLEGRDVLVVGGGRVAERKVGALLEARARVKIVSPEATEALKQMAERGIVSLESRPFRPEDCQDVWLVVAATDDPEVQDQVFSECERLKVFCNVVDVPERCSFIVPSQVRRDPLVLAISTAGESPALAKALRKRLEKEFPEWWAGYASLLGDLRRMLLATGTREAREACAELADLRVAQWLAEGRIDLVEQWATDLCGPEGRKAVERHFPRNRG